MISKTGKIKVQLENEANRSSSNGFVEMEKNNLEYCSSNLV